MPHNPIQQSLGYQTFLPASGTYNSYGVQEVDIFQSRLYDSFGRLKVSNPYTIFDSKQLHNKSELFFDEVLSGATSVHSEENSEVLLSTTADTQYAIRQTKMRFNYEPGKAQFIFLTGSLSSETNITKRIGYFNSDAVAPYNTGFDGIYFENDGTTVNLCVAKSGDVHTSIPRSSWDDPMDGTGKSRINIDFDKVQIFVIDFEWLGVGIVRFGMVVDGVLYYIHTLKHANNRTNIYMSSPNHSVRYEIRQSDVGSGSMQHICCSVITDGGTQTTGIIRNVSTGTTHIDISSEDVEYAVLGVKLRSGYIDTTVEIIETHMFAETNDNYRYRLLLNPVVNSGGMSYSGLDYSSIEYAKGVSANTITSGEGIVLWGGFGNAQENSKSDIKNSLRLGSKINGERDEIVLAITPFGANCDIHAIINFKELL